MSCNFYNKIHFIEFFFWINFVMLLIPYIKQKQTEIVEAVFSARFYIFFFFLHRPLNSFHFLCLFRKLCDSNLTFFQQINKWLRWSKLRSFFSLLQNLIGIIVSLSMSEILIQKYTYLCSNWFNEVKQF